ncbi:hypothetical protein BGZ94_000111 [Podila epigama]|nr:hypothetical protein BGZ94_000111 [Podila epigama]
MLGRTTSTKAGTTSTTTGATAQSKATTPSATTTNNATSKTTNKTTSHTTSGNTTSGSGRVSATSSNRPGMVTKRHSLDLKAQSAPSKPAGPTRASSFSNTSTTANKTTTGSTASTSTHRGPVAPKQQAKTSTEPLSTARIGPTRTASTSREPVARAKEPAKRISPATSTASRPVSSASATITTTTTNTVKPSTGTSRTSSRPGSISGQGSRTATPSTSRSATPTTAPTKPATPSRPGTQSNARNLSRRSSVSSVSSVSSSTPSRALPSAARVQTTPARLSTAPASKAQSPVSSSPTTPKESRPLSASLSNKDLPVPLHKTSRSSSRTASVSLTSSAPSASLPATDAPTEVASSASLPSLPSSSPEPSGTCPSSKGHDTPLSSSPAQDSAMLDIGVKETPEKKEAEDPTPQTSCAIQEKEGPLPLPLPPSESLSRPPLHPLPLVLDQGRDGSDDVEPPLEDMEEHELERSQNKHQYQSSTPPPPPPKTSDASHPSAPSTPTPTSQLFKEEEEGLLEDNKGPSLPLEEPKLLVLNSTTVTATLTTAATLDDRHDITLDTGCNDIVLQTMHAPEISTLDDMVNVKSSEKVVEARLEHDAEHDVAIEIASASEIETSDAQSLGEVEVEVEETNAVEKEAEMEDEMEAEAATEADAGVEVESMVMERHLSRVEEDDLEIEDEMRASAPTDDKPEQAVIEGVMEDDMEVKVEEEALVIRDEPSGVVEAQEAIQEVATVAVVENREEAQCRDMEEEEENVQVDEVSIRSETAAIMTSDGSIEKPLTTTSQDDTLVAVVDAVENVEAGVASESTLALPESTNNEESDPQADSPEELSRLPSESALPDDVASEMVTIDDEDDVVNVDVNVASAGIVAVSEPMEAAAIDIDIDIKNEETVQIAVVDACESLGTEAETKSEAVVDVQQNAVHDSAVTMKDISLEKTEHDDEEKVEEGHEEEEKAGSLSEVVDIDGGNHSSSLETTNTDESSAKEFSVEESNFEDSLEASVESLKVISVPEVCTLVDESASTFNDVTESQPSQDEQPLQPANIEPINLTCVPHKFIWTHGATSVKVTGTFDNWQASTELQQKGDIFEASVVLDRTKTITFKFVVDGHWVCAPDLETEFDHSGNQNNILNALV